MNDASVHIIHEHKGMLVRLYMKFIPRVGDEIRLADDKYYKVTLVVWALDEPECSAERVNIGVIDAVVKREIP